MKKITFYTSLFAAGILLFTACKKESEMNAVFAPTTNDNAAFFRIIHAAPGFRQVFNAPDSFNVYINGNKITSPFLTYGSIFPTATTGNGYIATPPGLQQIKMSVHGFASANPDSTLLINFTKVFTAGQYYTLFVTDVLKANPDASFVQDVFTKPLTGNVNLRFAHFVLNDTATKLVDVFSYARNATIFANIAPGTGTSFGSFGFNVAVADTFYITRPAAVGTPLANRIVLAKTAFSPTNQRTYTLYYRGDGNLTTGTKARTLTSYLHQ
jgi:hypothetical protein